MKRLLAISSMSAMAAAGICGPALAQTVPGEPGGAQPPETTAAPSAPPSTADQGATGADIVVTARKRAESLQDVPVSVTAVNAALIERNNITKIDQVAAITPNIQLQPVSVNPTNIAPYIRSIGNRAQEPSQDAPVVVSIDGVYLSDIAGSLVDVFDVQQIEVLRGPQGTLQGRNSPGGAINVVTRRPTGEFGARFETSYERFDLFRAKAAVEAPIAQDMLAAKISAFVNEGGAYAKNTFTGGEVGGIRTWGGRIGLLFTPTPDFTAYLTADYTRDRSQQPAIRVAANSTPQGPRQPVPAICFVDPAVFDCTDPVGKYENRSNFTDRNSSKNGGFALNADWDVGPVSLTSVTGYRFINEFNNTDVDNTPVTLLHAIDRHIKIRAFSQELRLASNGSGPLQYVVGVYGIRSKFDLVQPLELNGILAGLSPTVILELSSAREQVTNSRAIFGQASYNITDAWSISGGARQTWDRKHMLSTPAFSPTVADIRVKFDNLSIEAGTEYKLTEDVMAYFRFSQGYRSGGINGDAPTVAGINVYDPEELNSFEVGLKTAWLDRRLTANISAFHYDFTNIQIIAVDSDPIAGPVQRVVNGKGLKVDGIEFESSFRATPELTFQASIGYLDAKYDSQLVNIGFGPGTDLADLRKEYAPKFTGYFAVDYSVPLGDAGDLTFSGDVDYRSKMATSPVSSPITIQDKYAILNASITFRTADERYSLSLYGRNLTDKFFITTGEATGGALGFQAVGRPRIWGVRGTAKF